jgi:hypothetical protein
LRLFKDGPLDKLHAVDITVPGAISLDSKNHVLVLQDLGKMGTLWDLLSPEACASLPIDDLRSECAQLGMRIGNFLAILHSPEVYDEVRQTEAASTLTHNLTDEIIWQAAVQPLRQRLQQYNVEHAAILADRVAKDFRNPAYDYRPALSIGDFHPGSVLLEGWDKYPPDSELHRCVGIIDWEFASLNGRGVNGDLAQFLAVFHCYIMAIDHTSPAFAGTSAFIEALCRAYGANSQFNIVARPDNPGMQLLRSYLILHGREMINQAFEKAEDWGTDQENLERMVHVGAWYISIAGDSVEEMLSEENWAALIAEDSAVVAAIFRLAVEA